MTNRILLLRRSTDSSIHEQHDAYVREFSKVFNEVQCIAPLTEEFIAEETLAQIIRESPRHNKYWGVVVTSKRAVEAFHRVVRLENNCNELLHQWQAISWFAVGPGTAMALEKLLAIKSLGAECGEAVGLSRVIVTEWSSLNEIHPKTGSKETDDASSRLLFLSGEQRRDTLPRRLNEANCPFHEVPVYRVAEDAELAEQLRDVCTSSSTYEQDSINWLAFFSPSGVNIALPYLTQIALPSVESSESTLKNEHGIWKVAAIGATTADALMSAGIRVDAVASIPSAQAEEIESSDKASPIVQVALGEQTLYITKRIAMTGEIDYFQGTLDKYDVTVTCIGTKDVQSAMVRLAYKNIELYYPQIVDKNTGYLPFAHSISKFNKFNKECYVTKSFCQYDYQTQRDYWAREAKRNVYVILDMNRAQIYKATLIAKAKSLIYDFSSNNICFDAHRRVVLLQYDSVFPLRRATPERVDNANASMKRLITDLVRLRNGKVLNTHQMYSEIETKFKLYRYAHPRRDRSKQA
ncbi:tetrapyrrole biosynthesis, uroporphyrinogen III synthase [Syncephalis plumigaleata]|nr:tetrapyrrole biosynthesis, uroporphyrinogen III synthase [Syncephalis plumigaleata]